MTGLGETFAAVVTGGSLLLAFAVAALVGLISFASPCCLPLVPGYVSYIAGLAGADAAAENDSQPERSPVRSASPSGDAVTQVVAVGASASEGAGRHRLLIGSLLFVAGFSLVFVSFGALFGGLGRLLLEWAPVLTRVAGVVTIGMGLAFLGAVPWLQGERRLQHRPTGGLAGAPVLGVVFGRGGRRAWGPLWRRSTRSPTRRRRRCVEQFSGWATAWAWGSRSWRSRWVLAGRCACRRGLVATLGR